MDTARHVEVRRPRRSPSAALPVVAAGLLMACSVTDRGADHLGRHSDLLFLDGMLATDAAVTVAPDQYWGEHPDKGRWSFRNSASLVVRVHQVPDRDLGFWFVPDADTGRFHFTAQWDGEPLLDRPGRPSPNGTLLTIPRTLVTPGDHRLLVRRAKHMDRPTDRANHDNGFRELGWRLGEAHQPLSLGDRERLRYLADFLSRGLTGMSEVKMAGCLFEGGRRVTAELAAEDVDSVSFVVENRSPAPATFTVTASGASTSAVVAPGEQRPLELALDDRTNHTLALAVSGLDSGLYLWGAPFLARARPVPTGPVILITLDTTRRDVLSSYGGPVEATPHIEAFAQGATVYDAAYASSPWTLPSHASIFTGLYPSRHGAGVSDDHLPERLDTVAELLRSRGYFTAGFAGGEMCSSRWGVGQGFSLYRDPEGFETPGDRLTDRVLELVDRHRDEPLFLFVNYFDPHALYQAPSEFQNLFGVAALRERVRGRGLWDELADGSVAAWRAIITGEAEPTEQALDFLRAAYLAEIAFMDHQVGRLLTALSDHGLYDDALIVLVSDHGEYLGEGGLFSHCCRLDLELMEVPLLIKFPGQREPRRATELVSHVDLYETLLGGVEMLPHDGLALGREPSADLEARRRVFMEEHQSRIHPLFDNMKIADHLFGLQRLRSREVVWDGGIRCSERVEGRWAEATCAASWSDRLAELAALGRLRPGGEADEGVLSEEERRRLEALGYIR